MSDQAVAQALDELEALLAEPLERLDGGRIGAWHARFRAALDAAERGPGWGDLVERGHALGRQLDQRLGQAISERDALRQELDAGGQGARALKAYKPR